MKSTRTLKLKRDRFDWVRKRGSKPAWGWPSLLCFFELNRYVDIPQSVNEIFLVFSEQRPKHREYWTLTTDLNAVPSAVVNDGRYVVIGVAELPDVYLYCELRMIALRAYKAGFRFAHIEYEA